MSDADSWTGPVYVLDEKKWSPDALQKLADTMKNERHAEILIPVPGGGEGLAGMNPGKLQEKPTNPKDLIGSDKLPLGMVPATTRAYLTLGHLEGHLKYGLVNWREAGVKLSIYHDALNRHLAKFFDGGEWEDPETQVPHLANALACLSIIVDAYECGKLTDDRPKSAPVPALIDRFSEKVKHLKRLFGEKKPVDYFITGAKQRP